MTQSAIELIHNGKTLRGTFYKVIAPVGYVVLNHGFSANRMGTGRLLVELARRLSDAGYAVLAYDRLGHGESDGEFSQITASDEVRQLETVCAHLWRRSGSPVHVVGHSLGGMAAAVLGGERPDLIRSLTLWAPAGVFVDDIAQGQIQGDPVPDPAAGQMFDFDGQAVGPAFVRDAQGFDAFGGIGGFHGPVFVHHAQNDPIVPRSSIDQYLQAYGPTAELHEYDSGGHGWTALAPREALLSRTLSDIQTVTRQRISGIRMVK